MARRGVLCQGGYNIEGKTNHDDTVFSPCNAGLAGIACLSLLGATLTACDLWTTAGGLDIETTTPAPSVTLAPAPAPAPSTDTTSGSPSPSPTRSPTGNNVEAVEEYALHDGVFTFSADGSRTAEFTPPSGYYFSSNDNPQGGMAVAPDDPYCNYVFRRDDVFVDQIPSSQEMTDLLISGGYTDSTTTDVTKLGEFPAAATDILRYGDGDYRDGSILLLWMACSGISLSTRPTRRRSTPWLSS
ncbi:hypothetical protein DDD63_02205 [Actinobaculum sp. 313]|nr:hypothetical protein DDD63_02205 [Actinobaculum sp. 313]